MKLPFQCHFVLVHGAQHGGWCWFKTQELLEKSGQQVSAIDLVSAGASPVDADDVESFDHYSQPLYDLIEALPNDNKVIKRASASSSFRVAQGRKEGRNINRVNLVALTWLTI